MVIRWDLMVFNGIYDGIASGKHSHVAIEAMAIEIVDLPMKNGDFP